MSTILDALKKSEQERKLNNLPTLSDMPAPVERPSPLKLVLAIIVIAILLTSAVLALVYVIADQPPAVKNITNETVNANRLLTENGADAGSYANNDINNNTNNDTDNKSIVVSVISYSDESDKRFAIINGNIVRENEFIQPGIKVDYIQPDSVILNQRGQRTTLTP